MKRYRSKHFWSKALFAFCVILLASFLSPLCAAGFNDDVAFSPAINLNSAAKFIELDVPAITDINLIFNNAFRFDKIAGGGTDSESLTNKVIVTKASMHNDAAGDSGSSSKKRHGSDDTIQMGAIVTPEPATILILGLGSLVLIRKSRV